MAPAPRITIRIGACFHACCVGHTHVLEDRTDHSHSYRREWTEPYGLMGPPGAFGLLSDNGQSATQPSNNPPCFRYSMKNGSWPKGVTGAVASHST